ncbi:heavy metal translocating P-type ATPase [Stella sp.]|uniref:heavy metal translocating P-type ATPase n=1 Tax=Stella sp. TaxID=2912054 RepID=UPI0035AE99EC
MTASTAAREDLRLAVEGMDCPSCALKIETALGRLPGVAAVAVDVGGGRVRVTPGAEPPDPDAVVRTIRALGYAVPRGVAPRPPAGRPHDHGHDHAHGDCREHGHGAPDHGHDHAHAHAHAHDHDHGHDHEHGDDPADRGRPWWRTGRGRLVLASGVLLAAAIALSLAAPALGPWPFVAATLVALVPVARRAFGAASLGQVFTIEMLMMVAAGGALAIGAAEEAAVVVFLFAVGELLEGVAAQKARRSIAALADLTPKTAQLVEDGRTREVPAETLLPGQTVLVRPGDRVPCDGRIVAGGSAIDESPVNGESVPRFKDAGESVAAGTINITAALHVVVTRAAADNTIARIIRLVEDAQAAKAPVQRFIDRFSRVYMPAIVLVALLVALVPPVAAGEPWEVWVYRALALLLIACPCALVISTPAAVAAGLSAGARRGLLVKGGATLENIGRLRTIAFDKTGTLTNGRPLVTDVVPISAPPDEVLALAAGLEAGSSHPIARAILRHAEDAGVTPAPASDVAAMAGRGLRGTVAGRTLTISDPRTAEAILDGSARDAVRAMEEQGKTVAVLAAPEGPLGLLAVRDEPRADAREGLARLRRLGIRPVMLTGDNARTGQAVGRDLGIEVQAELLPEDKARIVAGLQAQGGPVGKVGDGINDAPALAAADVGIAMGAGTDVAIETADAALLHNRVGGVAELVRLSRATMANVRTNVAVALGSKAVFLVTTVLGLTGMWIAVLADTGATVLVTLNALRLLSVRLDDGGGR